LLKESFDIEDAENEDSLTYLRISKVHLNNFKILARTFKREEAHEQFKKYERILLKALGGE
jgi:hypothetical protein